MNADMTHEYRMDEDVEAHGRYLNANEPVDEDVEAHARLRRNASEPVDKDAE
jgi:hypothetical protein